MKRILYLPLALVAIFILSGCGGGQGITGSDNNSAGGADSLPTAEAPRVGGATDEDEGAFKPTEVKIAYVKGGTLFLYDAEKGLSTPLTREGVEVFTCTFLPGRDEICYTAVEENGKLSLRSITLADGEPMVGCEAIDLEISVSDCTAKDGSDAIGELWGLPGGRAVQLYKWMDGPATFVAGKLIDVAKGGVRGVEGNELTQLMYEKDGGYREDWVKTEGELKQAGEKSDLYATKGDELMYKEACLSCGLKLDRPEGFITYDYYQFSPDSSKLLFKAANQEATIVYGPWCVADTNGEHQVNLGASSLDDFRPAFVGERVVHTMRDYYGEEEWHLNLCLTDAGDNSPSVIVKDISYWCVRK